MEFTAFPKIARLSKPCVITEKLDGTNAAVHIDNDGNIIGIQSRTRFITPQDDNYGFARWVMDNASEISKLGPGVHFGEWWGGKVQRGYGLKEKKFSLFNVGRWNKDNIPSCVDVVPTLFEGEFRTDIVDEILADLKAGGSKAAPGFMNPEGVIVFHSASGTMFKKTFDDNHKG